MATVILLRHGRSSANTSGVLAGRTGGVHLDEVGKEHAERLARRLDGVPLVQVVSSPLERCQETAAPLLTGRAATLRLDDGLLECDYGDWAGREIKELLKEPLWRTVQRNPSAATFPGGEAMTELSARAIAAVRRLDAEAEAAAGPDAVWVAVSHGDVIKAILADALGMHLDLFQRINVDPGSASVIRYTPARPMVLATNTHEGSLGWVAKQAGEAPRGDAVVGGGSGPTRATA